MEKTVSDLSPNATPQYLPHHIRRALPSLGPIFYLETWPFSDPILVIASPSTAYQITQGHSLPKYPLMRKFVAPVAGPYNLLMEGQQWKTWRSIVNPCFSANNLTALVPEMINEVLTFSNILMEHLKAKDLFQLKTLTDNLVMDILGKVALWVIEQFLKFQFKAT